jgi:hypothetical protein
MQFPDREFTTPQLPAIPEGMVLATKDQISTLTQAIIEMRHAFMEPNWFTDGKNGANRQFLLWAQKGTDVAKTLAGEVKP